MLQAGSDVFGQALVTALAIFMFTWNARKYINDSYFLFLGIAYLFVGGLDTLHLIAYKDMPIFTDYPHYAGQIWIAVRFMESISLLLAFSFIGNKKEVNLPLLFAFFSFLTIIIISTIFYWKIFPVAMIEGKGLTQFKIISEYIICLVLIFAVKKLFSNKDHFEANVFTYLLRSIIFTFLAELTLTMDMSMAGAANIAGHFFKILSFKFIYEAIIATGLTKPYDLLFKDLKKSELALHRANITKDKFLSIISHDLKNPFNALVGFSGDLVHNYDSFDEESRKDFVKDIHESSKNMYSLLDNLLTWSTMQNSGIEFNPEDISLAALTDETINLLKLNARDKKINLVSTIDKSEKVYIDVNMTKTVIRNLVSNALKFTREGGKVNISSEEINGYKEITVSDTGIGISKKNIEKLFRIDMKHSTYGTNREEGTGLGLILC